ncbi:MAG: hypothetical protein WAU60_17795, partial [Candidatus Competibacter denitrificans]
MKLTKIAVVLGAFLLVGQAPLALAQPYQSGSQGQPDRPPPDYQGQSGSQQGRPDRPPQNSQGGQSGSQQGQPDRPPQNSQG